MGRHSELCSAFTVVALLVALLTIPCAQAADHESCPNTCAKGAAYQYLEYLQCADYNADPLLRKVWRSTATINSSFDSVINAYPGIRRYSKAIKKDLYSKQLPTCYESRIPYYMLTNYVDALSAIVRLTHPDITPPKYGTLPSTEINAFTIVTPDNDRIVAFNTQLSALGELMTYAIAPLVKTQELEHHNDPWTDTVASQVSDGNTSAQLAFVTALMEFIEVIPAEQLIKVPGSALPTEFNFPAMDLSIGMDFFEVGHEYAHVILGHRAISTKLIDVVPNRHGKSAPVTAPVAILSWKQELDADALGLHLVSEVAHKMRPTSAGERIYMLYGALYFFECMQILDEARYIADHGTPPQQYTDKEMEYLRSVASGNVAEDIEKQYSYISLNDHPPAWLRMERVRELMRLYEEQGGETKEYLKYKERGENMINYAQFLWTKSRPHMAAIIRKLEAEQDVSTDTFFDKP